MLVTVGRQLQNVGTCQAGIHRVIPGVYLLVCQRGKVAINFQAGLNFVKRL